MSEQECLDQAEACERAAQQAFVDGDYCHHDDLKARAASLRRKARELAAGVNSRWQP